MKFNLLQGVDSALVGKRSVDSYLGVRTSPSKGNFIVHSEAAEVLNLRNGDRVVVDKAPSFSNGDIKPEYPADSTGAANVKPTTLIIYKGYTSDADRFFDQFARDNPSEGLTVSEKKDYNSRQRAFVTQQLKATGSNDTNHFGFKCRPIGSNYVASSNSLWSSMGGNSETNVKYLFSEPQEGIVVHENGVAYSIADESDIRDEGTIYAFICLNESPDKKQQWKVVETDSYDTFKESYTKSFYILIFDVEEDKQSSSSDEDLVEETVKVKKGGKKVAEAYEILRDQESV